MTGLLSVLVGLALVAQEPPTMTLAEALNAADQNALPVMLAQNRKDKAWMQERSAHNALGPRVELSGTYSQQRQIFAPAAAGFGGFGPEGWAAYKSVTLALSQSVDINGLAHKAADAVTFLRQAEEANVETEKANLRANVRTKYFGLLQAVQLVRVQKDTLASARQRLAKSQIRFKEGVIPRFEVLRLEAEVSRWEQELVTAEGNADLTRLDLNNTIGIPVETAYTPVAVDLVPVPEAPTEALVATAMTNRSELRQIDLLARALAKQAKVATVDIKPSMQIVASSTRYLDPPAGGSQQFDSIGATIKGALWDGGVGRMKVRAAEQDAAQAKIQQKQVALAVSLSVRSAVTNSQTAFKARSLAAKNAELAREALRLAQLRYDEGAGILLDVIVAQSDHTTAQANQVNADYRYLQAFAQLQRAVGSDDLRPLLATETKGKTK